MSIEHIEVNGHELTAFDLPPEPSETYSVWVDGLGEVVVEKGKPPEKSDVPAKYMRKLIPALCEQNAELARENAKLRELLEAVLQCAGETKRDKGCDACPMHNGPWRNDGTWCLLCPTLRELGIEVKA